MNAHVHELYIHNDRNESPVSERLRSEANKTFRGGGIAHVPFNRARQGRGYEDRGYLMFTRLIALVAHYPTEDRAFGKMININSMSSLMA